MDEDRAGIPAGAGIAAAVLALMAFVGLLFAACSAYAMFMTNSALIPHIPLVRVGVGIADVLILMLVIMAVCTIAGLFRLRSWARLSMIFFGVGDFLFFATMAVCVLVGRVKSDMASMPIPYHPALTLGDIMLGLAGFYLLLALIGVWWVVYFSAKRVRLVFADAKVRLTH